MKEYDYWELFWLSGLPEAWMMSRPGRGDFNTAGLTAKAVPHRGTELPDEAQQLYQHQVEQGTADMPGPSLTGQ